MDWLWNIDSHVNSVELAAIVGMRKFIGDERGPHAGGENEENIDSDSGQLEDKKLG